jgi:hydrogenase nickel incorporation protein HypB
MHLVQDVELGTDILAANTRLAEENRKHLRSHGVKCFDVQGAIGSGKTLIIEGLIDILKGKGIRCAVVAGDVAGDDDYRRFRAHDVQVINVNTGKECHLDAHLVDHAIEKLDLDKLDVLFIENVGNLVCPADFPLGSDKRVTVVSVTEGDDMVRKHPVLMGMSDIIVVNKISMADAMGVDPQVLERDARAINPHVPVVFTDARTGQGLDALLEKLGLD